eukprot:gene49784-67602_t
MVSYEVSIGLIIINVILLAGTMNLSSIVASQEGWIWNFSAMWMLWMLLANLLGQIHHDRRIDLTSPIHSSSDLFCLFSLRNDPTEEVSNNDETDAFRNSFCRERKWWYGRILSTSNLDDFVDSILSSDVDMLMEELQHLDPWDSLR